MTEYVAGFLFDAQRKRVALVEKRRPDWQAGRLNGIGGRVEPGESPYGAMVREFHEETGVTIASWRRLATLHWEGGRVHFYRAFSTRALESVTTVTDERILVHRVDRGVPGNVLPNLSWLIPLARYTHDTYQPIEVTEVCAQPVGNPVDNAGDILWMGVDNRNHPQVPVVNTQDIPSETHSRG